MSFKKTFSINYAAPNFEAPIQATLQSYTGKFVGCQDFWLIVVHGWPPLRVTGQAQEKSM